MSDINEVSYVISVKNLADAAFDSVKNGFDGLAAKSRSIQEQMDTHWQTFKKNWLAVTAAVYAGWEMLKKAWNMAEIAASYNEHMQLIDGLARRYGTSAPAIVDKIRQIGDGMLSLTNIAETVDSAMTKGMKPDMLYGLAEAAVVLSDSMKMTADQAFSTLVSAMESGREKTIKLSVGVIDLKERYGEMAGKMSEAEKQAALYSMIMETVKKVQTEAGSSTKSTADEMESLIVTLKDLELTLGQGILRAGAGVVGTFQALASAGNFALGAVAGLNASIADLLATVTFGETSKAFQRLHDELIAVADVAFKEAERQATAAGKSFNLMMASTEDLQRATAKQTAATMQHAGSIGEQQKVLEMAQKGFDAYAKVLQAAGEAELKMANDAFGQKLKDDAVSLELIDKKIETHTATLSDLQAGESAYLKETLGGLTTYLAKIREVYDVRIAGEKEIAAAMERAGSKPADVQKAKMEVLKLEKAYYTDSLAGYKAYYDALTAQHTAATNAMMAKTKELQALESNFAAQRRSAADQQMALQEKLLVAQGKGANDIEIYNMKMAAAQDLYWKAMTKDGEEKIKLLEEARAKYGELDQAVTKTETTRDIWENKNIATQKIVISQQDAIKAALENTNAVQIQIEAEQDRITAAKKNEISVVAQWKSELETAMSSAKQQMDMYKGKIQELSQAITAMDKKIALTANADQAVGVISQVQSMLDSLRDKTVYVNVVTTASGVGGSAPAAGNFQYYDQPQSADNNVGAWAADAGGYGQHAMGNIFDMGDVVPFGNGDIFNTPTFFPMPGGKTGMLGEDGYEAIMPLTRGRDGKLGVKAQGAAGNTVNLSFTWSGNIVGTNKSPEMLAREISRLLPAEFRRLAAVKG